MNDKQNKNLNCPICESTQVEKKYQYHDMTIYLCPNCKMMFQDPENKLPQNNQLADNVFNHTLWELECKKQISKTTVKRISSHLNKPLSHLKILELGVGTGALAEQLIENEATYFGLEPSETLYTQSLKNFPNLLGKIDNYFLSDSKNLPKDFDLIIMIDVLEHIPYPVAFLKNLKQYLKKEGCLYLEIPNESLLKYRGGLRSLLKIYSGYPTYPGHVSLFTTQTIRRALEKAEFKISSLFSFTILGEYERLKIIAKKDSLFVKILSQFFKTTKLDLIFKQGNIAAMVYLR